MSVLTTKQIMEIIPHRQPFLLIDTVEELESGMRAVAKKCVSYNAVSYTHLTLPTILLV